MRSIVAVILGLGLVAAVGAQAPPANARDITNLPLPSSTAPATPAAAPDTTPAAPDTAMPANTPPPPAATALATESSTSITPPATVLRVYIGTLTGADASAISGLLAQALYQSKQVVVTENQSNASVQVAGEVLREPVASPAATTGRRGASRRRATGHQGTGSADTGDAGVAAGSADLGGDASDALSGDLSGLPGLESASAPVDLSRYRYRLNLEIVDPAGDVLWMSGRGQQAAPFQGADAAVAAAVQSMLGVLTPAAGTAARP